MSLEVWEMQPDYFDWAALSDRQLGGLYRDWVAMWEYIGAYPDMNTLAQYADWARDILDRQAPEEAGDFTRFARVRLAGSAQGYGFAPVETAYKNGKDVPDFHYQVVKRALADGCPVPPEVIAGYPDLAAVYAPRQVTPLVGDAQQTDDLLACAGLPRAGGLPHTGDLPDTPPKAGSPLLPDGRPRAPLPEAVVKNLRPRHELVYHPCRNDGDARFPYYGDDVLVIQGVLYPDVRHWAARYRQMGGDASIHLWEGTKIGGVDIIKADSPQACAAALFEHLAAWGYDVEIVLQTTPASLPEKPAGRAEPTKAPAQPPASSDSGRRPGRKMTTQLSLF